VVHYKFFTLSTNQLSSPNCLGCLYNCQLVPSFPLFLFIHLK